MRQAAGRVVLSALIVLHIVAGIASEARDTAWGRPVYDVLRPAQASLALWQNWAMFSPPPRATSGLVAEGRLPDGSWVPLDLPRGLGQPGELVLRYDRFGKLERSALKESRARLQRSIAHWVCRQARDGGTPVDQVRILQHSVKTPRPALRGQVDPKGERKSRRRVVCR